MTLILSEVVEFFTSFISNLPKPFKILFVLIFASFVISIIPVVYEWTTNYECNENIVYTGDSSCERVMSAYNYNCNDKNLSIIDRWQGVFFNFDEYTLEDNNGNIYDSSTMCVYDNEKFLNIYCEPYEPSDDEFIYPECIDGTLEPTFLGNNIFNYKTFVVLVMLIWIMYLVFYFWK